MKGQAYDTFKLMIAAVIAVAILGILLGILGGISPQVGDPVSLIKQKLGQAYNSPGATYASNSKANFQKKMGMRSSTFSSILGGTGTVKFMCADKLKGTFCETKSNDKTLKILKKFDAEIYTCCSDSKCYVSIGDATDKDSWCE